MDLNVASCRCAPTPKRPRVFCLDASSTSSIVRLRRDCDGFQSLTLHSSVFNIVAIYS